MGTRQGDSLICLILNSASWEFPDGKAELKIGATEVFLARALISKFHDSGKEATQKFWARFQTDLEMRVVD